MNKGYTNFEGQDWKPVSDYFKIKNKIKIELTSKELHMLYEWFNEADENLYKQNSKGLITDEELENHNNLYEKLRDERFNFFINYKRKL